MWTAQQVINTGLNLGLCYGLHRWHGALPYWHSRDGRGRYVREHGAGYDPGIHGHAVHPAVCQHPRLHPVHHGHVTAEALGRRCGLWEVCSHVSNPTSTGLDPILHEAQGRDGVGRAKALIHGGWERDVTSVSRKDLKA